MPSQKEEAMTRAEKIEEAATAATTCPVCGEGIYDNQSRVTSMLNEMPRTVHRTCVPPMYPTDAPPATPAADNKCSIHGDKWQEGTPCECGGRRVWHDGLGSTTTDIHWRCEACGKDRYVDGIDA